METIFALASARGKAGVSVLRISGTEAFEAGQKLAGNLPQPRHSAVRVLKNAAGEALDEALVLTFAAGSSFTGEDTVELQLHGSIAVISAVLQELGAMAGLRLAEPGEFTRRALENERLDLAQIEGLGDLIEAETEAQRKQAFRVLSGALGQKAESWRTRLIRAAALMEATIDFADEDVPVDVSPEVLDLIDAVASELRIEAEGAIVAERIRDGFEIAIVGAPNAGKSTLLNALAGRDAAITSEVAGTTRDVIEVRMDLNGLPVTVLDTAGLRETDDLVEGLGIERALVRAEAADIRVFLQSSDHEFLGIHPKDDDITVLGKADISTSDGFAVSGKTGQGVSQLISRITAVLEQKASGAGAAIRERHRVAILNGIEALESARIEVCNGPDRAELAAEDLRTVIRALDSLVGRVDVEQILDEIFASFCLGK